MMKFLGSTKEMDVFRNESQPEIAKIKNWKEKGR